LDGDRDLTVLLVNALDLERAALLTLDRLADGLADVVDADVCLSLGQHLSGDGAGHFLENLRCLLALGQTHRHILMQSATREALEAKTTVPELPDRHESAP